MRPWSGRDGTLSPLKTGCGVHRAGCRAPGAGRGREGAWPGRGLGFRPPAPGGAVSVVWITVRGGLFQLPQDSQRRGVRRQEVLAETLGVKGCRGREGPPGKEWGAVGLCGSGRNFHPSDPRVACLAGSSQAASAPTCRVRAPTEGPLDRSLTHCCVLDRPLPQQDWPGLCPWVSVPLWAAWVGHHDHFQGPPALVGSWPPLTPP